VLILLIELYSNFICLSVTYGRLVVSPRYSGFLHTKKLTDMI